jgi:hypothetical protein
MSRARLTLIALGMAFALPALTGADEAPGEESLDASICAAASQVDHDNPQWQWRLRAYRHLDCVTALVDAALAQSGANRVDEHVMITRRELERIRDHAWWARDAAARIGR